MAKPKHVAVYVRVSTDKQTVDAQLHQLQEIAERRGWQVVEVYRDEGISGAKGRDKRPGLDALLNDASRRRFDVVMAWAIDRLGRSLIDLLGTIQHLEAAGVDLYLDRQNIDTTTSMGRLLFQITGALRLGRPWISPELERKVRAELAKGTGINKTAKLIGVGNSTVDKIAQELRAGS
jgi:DNA invertase Pin-like site-specific DNA recombinase